MTIQTIINVLIVILGITFFILTVICLRLNDVKISKPLEDKYSKIHKKYIVPSSRITAWLFITCIIGLLIFDNKQTMMVWDIRLTPLVFLIFLIILNIFVIAKYYLLHKYTKRRF